MLEYTSESAAGDLTEVASRAAQKIEDDRATRRRAKERERSLRGKKEPGIPLARVKRPPAPDAIDTADVYREHGLLLVAAEQERDSVRRTLGVTCALLRVLADIRESAHGSPATSRISVALGTHTVSLRDLPSVPTSSILINDMAFYCASDTFDGVAHGVSPLPCPPGADPKAQMLLTMFPVAAVREDAKGDTFVEIDLKGSFRVVFASHQEEHICTAMPTVRLLPVTGSASRCSVRLVFQGEIALVCPARGLSLTAILAEDGTCRGTVTRMLGDADVSVASIKGSLQAGIFAASDKGVLPITGPLGDGSPVDLADIGPRKLKNVWRCIHDAIFSTVTFEVPAVQSADQRNWLMPAMRAHLDHLAVGMTPLHATDEADDESETDSDCDEASRAKRPPQVPPCVWAERAKGRRLRTELHYTVLDGSARSARVVYVDPK